MKEITSINNEYIKYLLKLKEKKYRNIEKKYIVEGYHLVNEAYKANVLKEVLLIEDTNEYPNISKILVNENIIKKLSSTITPQNILGVCEMRTDSIIKGDKILLLDNINDPGNLGTLIRTSLGFGIDTIVLGSDCVDMYNDKVLRGSQGAIFKVNIVVDEIKKSIGFIKRQGIPVIGTSLECSQFLQKINKPKKYAILLGNEANGVKKELLEMTDINVKIEISNKLESLNVAVAGSILMYYLNS